MRASPGRLEPYRARRDFSVTGEPAPADRSDPTQTRQSPIFVVQKHDARRLHWDFRLEHEGALWSWAVPKGPSLDPHDKRLAVHVEDHPRDYADFHGTIPEGQYGAGTVETWDRGTWLPVGDAAEGMARGELKFVLNGSRLNGKFVLVRLKPRPREKAENWLLIKEHDEHEREGVDAAAIEAETPPPKAKGPTRVLGQTGGPTADASFAKKANAPEATAPAAGAASEEKVPNAPRPQLASLVDVPPSEAGWISEVKFDGYRILAIVDGEKVCLLTRNGLDWTHRLKAVAAAIARLKLGRAVVDGELVALRNDGVSHFGDLQAALADGKAATLFYYAFDLLHWNGWDLRGCALLERKRILRGLAPFHGAVRYSDHVVDDAGRTRRHACAMGLEGIICKQADAPYRAGRTRSWVKLKCQGRDEFLVVGWTRPAGSRVGIGALHLGFHDGSGRLHYAGGVGTGFSERELVALRETLDRLAADPPSAMLYAGDPPDHGIAWVTPTLVVEVQYLGWSGAGRLRHATYLGQREDKNPEEIVMDIPDPEAERHELGRPKAARIVMSTAKAPKTPPRTSAAAKEATSGSGGTPPARLTVARAGGKNGGAEIIDGVRVTHADRALWPGITKHDLAEYWRSVARHALPEIAGRPLALVRCPDGIAGEHFFQKHGKPGFPEKIRAGEADGAPYLVIDDEAGLIAAAQIAAVELHAWGASGADPLHPDRLVFDLDPGDGVAMPDIVAAAKDVRDRLKARGLAAFCRTSGGKGLHVVAPLKPSADWDQARKWCRAFAERMAAEDGARYVASVPKARRRGRILVDWLRNGLGSTSVASFSPRARDGALVATRLAWREVTDALDPGAFTLGTVPRRLSGQKRDAWDGFDDAAVPLPEWRGDK